MPCNPDFFQTIGGAARANTNVLTDATSPRASQAHSYITSDDAATVGATGYFSPVRQFLQIGDTIDVTYIDSSNTFKGAVIYRVTSKSLASISTTSVSTNTPGQTFGTINFALLGDSRLALQCGTILNLNAISWNGGGSSTSGQIRFGFSVAPNLRVGQKIRYVGTTGDASTAVTGTYTLNQCVTTTVWAASIDSTIASGTGTTGTLTNLELYVDAGWVFWATSLSGQKLRCVYNGGRGGDSASQAAARISEITTRTDVSHCFIDVGVNDYNQQSASAAAATVTSTTAGVMTYIDQICTNLLAANITPVLMTMYGVSSNFTNAANIMAYVTQHNNLLRNYAANNQKVMLIDQAAVTIDPTSGYLLGGASASAWSPDGIHPARMLGRSVGALVKDTFNGAIGSPNILTSGLFDNARSNASNYNVIQNAPWVNTGGTVTAITSGTNIGTAAQGWWVQRTVSTGTTATFTNGSANIGWTSHGLAINDPVMFTTSGGLPTNFAVGTRYYVVSVPDSNTITVSATVGGGAITAGSAGSGTQTGYRASVCSVAARTLASDGDAIGYNQVVDYASHGSSDILETRINLGNDSTYYTLLSTGTYELRGTLKLTNVAGSNLKSISCWSYLTFTDTISTTAYTNVAQVINPSASDATKYDTTLGGYVSSLDTRLVIRSQPMTFVTAPTGQFNIGIRSLFQFSGAGTAITISQGRWSLVKVA